MNTKSFHKGFTVLEFLIVLAIILILIAILLPNLQRSRERSNDEKRITQLKTVALGIEQYKQICGSYPEQIMDQVHCSNLLPSTLGDLIPDITTYNFNNGQSGFYYFAISRNYTNRSDCDGFHLGVKLENTTVGQLGVGDSNHDSDQNEECLNNQGGLPIAGKSDEHIFDIYR